MVRAALITGVIATVNFPARAIPGSAAARATVGQASDRAKVTPPAPKKPRPARYDNFQVPAGTPLSLELRTVLDSSASNPQSQVRSRLKYPIEIDGVQLVPAGSIVLGTVHEAVAAGANIPGRLTFGFHVIEHPDSGSLAMIRTNVATYQSGPPVKGKKGLFKDVRLESGSTIDVSLAAPLLVKIPRN